MLVFGLVVAAVAIMAATIYNKLVRLKNAVKNALSQIDVQLTRRFELIPNLVETAKKFMSHERETFEAVVQARNMAVGAQKKVNSDPANTEAVKELQQAENQLMSQMSRMLLIVENYPELKANETMKGLMEELTSTENKVSFSRQAYNDSVMSYNTSIQVFPNNIFAGMFSFKEFEFLKVEDPKAKEPVKVSFD
ncbi:MAG: LemA family protein [Bdellovibrionaceae bacterium]|nr:LemA family protein [Pseudobdellovibrionaceae bacterium]